MRYVIGLDLGTTAVKVGLFDENGRTAAVSTQEYKLITPSALIVEQDPEVYWASFKQGLAQILGDSGVNIRDITALAMSAQSETLVFADDRGAPLRNAIVWMDNRAQSESDALEEHFSNARIQAVTGQPQMLAAWPAAKILWVRQNEPEVFARVGKFLLLEDYFVYRMTGRCLGEGSLWSSSVLWDITRKCYWQEMLDCLGIGEDQLPEIVESTAPAGPLLPGIAKELGLDAGTLVVMGGQDQACGAIGVGNVRAGTFSESTGAALASCIMVDRPVMDPNGQMPLFYSCVPGMYMISAFSSGGIAYKWLRDTLCAEESSVAGRSAQSAYAVMDGEACTIPAGSDGLIVLPHFMGAGAPDSDQYAKCMVYGLCLSHTKAHLIRGFMEGIAVVLTRMIEALEQMDIAVDEIRSLSGGAKSPLWCQIKADVSGKPVCTMKNTDDAACLGAAILAGVGAGLWADVQTAAQSFAEKKKTYAPNPDNRQVYDGLLGGYKLLMQTNKAIFPQL